MPQFLAELAFLPSGQRPGDDSDSVGDMEVDAQACYGDGRWYPRKWATRPVTTLRC